MILSNKEALIIVAVVTFGTIITRFLPFILFSNKSESPYIDYLGTVLPYAAIGLLVVYCLKGINVLNSPHGIPEAIAIVIIGILYYWKESTLISIGAGTIIYMFLVQVIFV